MEGDVQEARMQIDQNARLDIYVRLAKLPPKNQRTEFAHIKTINPSLLPDRDINQFQQSCNTLLQQDPVIQAALSELPPAARQKALDYLVQNSDLGDRISAGLQEAHEKISQLPQSEKAKSEQVRKAQEVAQAKQVAQLAEKFRRALGITQINGQDLNVAIEDALGKSANASDASRLLMDKFGIGANEIVAIQKYSKTPGKNQSLPPFFDEYQKLSTLLAMENASLVQMVAQSVDMSLSQQPTQQSEAARLKQQEAIITDLKLLPGEAVREILTTNLRELEQERVEIHRFEEAEALKTQSQEDSRALAALNRAMETDWVSYDEQKGERNINGDNIIAEMKFLAAYGERGQKLLIAQKLGLIDKSAVEGISNQTDPKTRQEMVDSIFLNLEPAQQTIVANLLAQKGAEYRQGLVLAKLEMDQYLSEGMLGQKLRLKNKANFIFDGKNMSIRDINSLIKNKLLGKFDIKEEEWKRFYKSFGADYEAAKQQNANLQQAENDLKEKGIITDSKLKYLLWFLITIMGFTAGAAYGVLPLMAAGLGGKAAAVAGGVAGAGILNKVSKHMVQ